jgi:CubicO group peptidase (beta-lactamase class C family)
MLSDLRIMLMAMLVLILSVSPSLSKETNTFPKISWQTDTPENHGLKSKALEKAADKIGWTVMRYCFVVIKDGYLVYERYYFGNKDSKHRAYSLTKSLAAMLVGVAATKGLLSLDDPISTYPPSPAGMNPQATIRHVLSQVSQSNPPGSGFKYTSKEIVDSLGKIISISARKAGLAQNSKDFANNYFLKQIGLIQGIDWPGEDLSIGKGSCGTCRAYARLGLLFLNRGKWAGKQLVAQTYVKEAMRPQYPQTNTGYGYFIWLNNDLGNWVRPFSKGHGKMIKNAPASMVMATGFLGQLVYILPESNVVVVSMGLTPRLETLKTAKKLWNAFGPAVTGHMATSP